MVKVIAPPYSRATGVGALPHTDPVLACDDVLNVFPEFPYTPTLPDHGLLESIVFNDAAQLPASLSAKAGCFMIVTGITPLRWNRYTWTLLIRIFYLTASIPIMHPHFAR